MLTWITKQWTMLRDAGMHYVKRKPRWTAELIAEIIGCDVRYIAADDQVEIVLLPGEYDVTLALLFPRTTEGLMGEHEYLHGKVRRAVYINQEVVVLYTLDTVWAVSVKHPRWLISPGEIKQLLEKAGGTVSSIYYELKQEGTR